MRSFSTNLVWSPLPESLAHLTNGIRRTLESWDGTKYRSGQRLRGVDADCIGFACSQLDLLDGRARACSPLLPTDAALHSPEKARNAVAAIRRMYDPAELVAPGEDGKILAQPMDILVVESGASGPGHMMLVGPDINTLWHCNFVSGVTKTGWSLFSGYERVFALYRLLDRERWTA